MDTIGRSLVLTFADKEVPCLTRVEFLFSSFVSKPIIMDIARGGGQLNWSASVIGLALCFIEYKIREKTASDADFQFDDKTYGGSVASFAGELERPSYVTDMFGYPVSAAHPKIVDTSARPVYRLIFGGANRSGRNKTKPRIVLIRHAFLPPACVTILRDQKQPSIHELQELAKAVRMQWEPHRRRATPPGSSEASIAAPPVPQARSPGSKSSAPPPSVTHQVTSTSAEPITSPQTGKKTASTRPKKRRKRVHQKNASDRMEVRGNQSMVKWLRRHSIEEIRLRLVAAHASNDAEELSKMLKTDCCIIIANKLANGDDITFYKFYCDLFGSIPVQIRVAVSKLIAADYYLQREVLKNMTKADEYLLCLYEWFLYIDEYYPSDFFYGIHQHLYGIADIPELRQSLKRFDREDMRKIIVSLLERGLEVDALVLIDYGLKHDSAYFRSVLKTQHQRNVVQLLCGRLNRHEKVTKEDLMQLQGFFGAKKVTSSASRCSL